MIKSVFNKLFALLPENNRLERIWILAKTDFKERYYGSSLGLIWAFINPLFQLIIYYYVFTVIFPTNISNFSLYIFSGLLFWMFFAESTKKGMAILQSKRYLIENIQLNKLDIFYASILCTSIAFAFNMFIYFAASLLFPISYTLSILFFPVLIINICLFIFALSLILSIIHIYLHDINHLWDIILLVLFWTIPIFYDQNIIIEQVPLLIYINPLTGIVINLRQILLLGTMPNMFIFVYDMIFIVILTIFALIIFKLYSHKVAEIR